MIILDYFNISAGNPSIILVALVLWFPLLQSFCVLCHLSNRFPWTHTWPFTLVNWNPSIVSFAKNPPSPVITFWLYLALYALILPQLHCPSSHRMLTFITKQLKFQNYCNHPLSYTFNSLISLAICRHSWPTHHYDH